MLKLPFSHATYLKMPVGFPDPEDRTYLVAALRLEILPEWLLREDTVYLDLATGQERRFELGEGPYLWLRLLTDGPGLWRPHYWMTIRRPWRRMKDKAAPIPGKYLQAVGREVEVILPDGLG